MSFESKLREEERGIEAAVLEMFSFVHTKGSDNPDGLQGQMMPLFHIVDAEWRAHVVGAHFDKPPEKDQLARFIHKYCKGVGAVLAVFASEAWYRTAAPDEKDPLEGGVANHPDRVEGLLMSFDSALGQRLVMYPIIRTDGVRLGDRQEWPGEVAGRFTGFVRTLDG